MYKYAITVPKISKQQRTYGTDYRVYNVLDEDSKYGVTTVRVTGYTDYSKGKSYEGADRLRVSHHNPGQESVEH